jgi:hypothetical protein
VTDVPNFEDWLYTPTEQPRENKLKLKHLKQPIWTENKARFIQRYLYSFVMVTKHGTYIDAFAGPQRINKPDAWAAKLVLEGQPRTFYLRNDYLIELDQKKIPLLDALRDKHQQSSGDRRVKIQVRQGDCNVIIPELLAKRPISDREATFCLLEQRTFECHWSTIETLADTKRVGTRLNSFTSCPTPGCPAPSAEPRAWSDSDGGGDGMTTKRSYASHKRSVQYVLRAPQDRAEVRLRPPIPYHGASSRTAHHVLYDPRDRPPRCPQTDDVCLQ